MATNSAMPANFPPGYSQQDNGQTLYKVSIAFIILEILFVMLRCYGHYLAKAKFGVDDILMIPSLITCVAVAALSVGTCRGLPRSSR